MSAAEILVTLGGLMLSVLILWYFFWSEGTSARARPSAEGVQEIRVQVQGGYDPDVLIVEAGHPVRIDFYRNETADCSEEVVFGDFGIRRTLPAFQTTQVEFTPEQPGEYEFACAMGMMRGKLIVEPNPEGARNGDSPQVRREG